MTSAFVFTKLVVGDLDRSLAFYERVFGFVEERRIDAVITGRPITEVILGPTPPGGATLVLLAFLDQPKPAADESILGFFTPDIAALIERAVEAGGSIAQAVVSMPEHGAKIGFIKDNEGHLIEVLERL
jgi:predicted enzyme related to lactoylglutathione lyase